MQSKRETSHNILIVDDDEAVREVLATLLQVEGHRCATAEDALTAIAMLSGAPFDLILSDLKMPGGDGLWLLDQVKRMREPVPLVILTGHGGKNRKAEILQRGAAGFLRKPPDIPELLELIDSILTPR